MSRQPPKATQQALDAHVAGGGHAVNAIAAGVPDFTPVTVFTTFTAEYAVQNGDIIVHFYLPPDLRGPVDYWTMRFPMCLDAIARPHFSADRPRLRASYTPEYSSWWFRANGYGHIIDLDGFIQAFFEKLDAALEGQG